jgi:electron transport complex protein RnfB
MLTAILAMTLLSSLFGLLLGYAAIRFKVDSDPLADQIDTMLPQTQCGQCGYPGCRPYADAVSKEEAEINLCAPGGEEVMLSIAELLGKDPVTVEAGEESGPKVAYVVEQDCIGCTLCLKACPVDAILGAPKHMHVVIADECTGCELCLPPCPVECIFMKPVASGIQDWTWDLPSRDGSLPPPQASAGGG